VEDFSVELTNIDTGDIKVVSFDTEEERKRFISKLPSHIEWFTYENGQLFKKCVGWEIALG